MIVGWNRFEDETGSRKTETGNFRHWKLLENFKCSLNHDWESFNFIYYSTQFDDYLWYMILRGKKLKHTVYKVAPIFQMVGTITHFITYFLPETVSRKTQTGFIRRWIFCWIFSIVVGIWKGSYMIYHSTQSDDYLWYLILRRGSKKKLKLNSIQNSSPFFRKKFVGLITQIITFHANLQAVIIHRLNFLELYFDQSCQITWIVVYIVLYCD